MPDYGSASYWDERYAASEGQVFDWYQGYGALRPLIEPFLEEREDFEILIPGCGTSRLGAELYEDGYRNITNIDQSSVAISQMIDRFADCDEMDFAVMDVLSMDGLPDSCFDLAIDKALFDAVLCREDNISSLQRMLGELNRVLRPGGTLLIVSHGVPATRLGYLNNDSFNWDVEYVKCPKPAVEGYSEPSPADSHFVYICKKKGDGQ